MSNRTSVVIAHRMSTVECCTRVAVIDDGKIVEEGTYPELKNKSNGYLAGLAKSMRKSERRENKRNSLLA